jgi:cyclopropane-fatty-acyl-phospholipid synthase
MSELVPQILAAAESTPGTALERFLRARLLRTLSGIRFGRLIIRDALGVSEFGGQEAMSPVSITVSDMAFYRMAALHGSVGAGDAYGDGLWQCDDLVALVCLLVRNRDLLDGLETGLARIGRLVLSLWNVRRRNTPAGSRRNIAAHYDLGNDFFATFLSQDLMYSAALWLHETDTLEQASARKLAAICAKLDLRPGDRVMEIGTGWGGFALYAASHYGCHVTTTTISREQHRFVSRRVLERGLSEQISVLLEDYRHLRGLYDKVVSIEMIEAVGPQYLQAYFGKIADLMKPDGRALIQAITIEDHRYARALAEVDFIKRFVFPGSFIPSINAMLSAKTGASDLSLVHLEDFGNSYARTLSTWRQRFRSRLDGIRAQGFDERFIRLWEFYLAYCEGGFLERSIGVAHLLFTRSGARAAAGGWSMQLEKSG